MLVGIEQKDVGDLPLEQGELAANVDGRHVFLDFPLVFQAASFDRRIPIGSYFVLIRSPMSIIL